MIEKGTHLRVKLIGTRSDVGSMFAIGTIKEDFLGFELLISLRSIISDVLVGPYEICFALATRTHHDAVRSPDRYCHYSITEF